MHSQAPPQMQCRQQSFSNLAFGGEQEMPQQFLSYVPHQFMPFYNPNYHGKMSYPEAPLQCPPNGSCTDAASPTSLRKTGKAPRKPRTTNIVFPRRKAGEAQREAEPVVITLELLQKYFDLPLHVAAKELGICATAIKKACRKVGVMRWPFRDHRFLRPASSPTAVKVEKQEDERAQIKLEEVSAASEAETASAGAESPRSVPSDEEISETPTSSCSGTTSSSPEDVVGFLSLCDTETLEELYKDVHPEESHACSMMWMQA